VIELHNVAKTHPGGVHALRDVSFSVPTGTCCALLGHNGAGKTTTIKILSTLMHPSSGTALVAGYDIVTQPAHVRASIGVTGQDASVDPRLTGRENLVLFGRLWGLSRRAARERAEELLVQFDMVKAAERRVSQYSGGMRRRIDIATSLVVFPKVLFLDEPTTGLDPVSRREVWALVSSLKAQDTTVLLTTQYLEEADVLSDSVVILNAGEVAASGTADDLKRQMGFIYCQVTPENPVDLPRVAAVLQDYEGLEVDSEAGTVSIPASDGVATLAEVFKRIDVLGVDVSDIALRKPTLDEVFMHLTMPTTA
jgi:ABC-2 type transport system ATP-binding protein